MTLIPPNDIRLRQRALPIAKVRKGERDLFRALVDLMRLRQGIGIAAPQVGDMRRLCVVQRSMGPAHCMANPEVIAASPDMVVVGEGRLSFPGETFPVKRHRSVTVRYLDAGNVQRVAVFDGLAAVCAQHEIDHLDGVLAHMRAAGGGVE